MRWRLLAGAVALVLLGAMLVTAYRLGEEGPSGFVDVPRGNAANIEDVPADFEPLVELYEQLRSEAVDPPAPEQLIEGAKKGMLDALDDPYARYYDPRAYATFNEELDGVYSGVGMELDERADGLFVVTVFPNTPAEQAGVQPGDRIVGVDGEDVTDDPIEMVVQEIRGEEGTEVSLDVLRDGEQLTFDMVRATIPIPRIEAELLDDRLGYVRMFHFTGGVSEDLQAEVDRLLDQGADGILLDLRGNPGGLLREAVRVASVFLADEVVVRVVEQGGEEDALEASGNGLVDVPLVVLVNEGTASASEIVAAAFQDTGRAEVVGQPTFGKGTVQTIKSLIDGSGAKFTTAEYFTSSGATIEDVGVQPDRVVEGEDEQLAAAREVLRSQLAGVGP